MNPVWPLLASMFAGAWLAYPWFVLNAFALGGRRRFADLAIAVGGLLASALCLFAYTVVADRKLLGELTAPYLLLLPVAVRLVSFYWLFMRQEQVFGLYTYFGGKKRNAMLVVVLAAFLRSRLLGGAPPLLQHLLG